MPPPSAELMIKDPRACRNSILREFPARVSRTASERAGLKVKIPALAARDAKNLLTLGANDNGRFRSAAAAKNAVRSRSDHVLAEGNEKFDFFRWREIRNRHGINEHSNGASRAHETAVTFDDEAARVLRLR